MFIARIKQHHLFLLILCGLLAGCSSSFDTLEVQDDPERLGTALGDMTESKVINVTDLQRKTEKPLITEVLYYSAQEQEYPGRHNLWEEQYFSPLGVHLRLENEREKPFLIYPIGQDQKILQGVSGETYRLIYVNESENTYEIVASVDGLDVITRQPASISNAGYVLRPHSRLVIDGFRKDKNSIEKFMFSKPIDNAAAKSKRGIRNSGVISTAIFQLYNPNAQMPEAFSVDKK